jgi:hypothetical protein
MADQRVLAARGIQMQISTDGPEIRFIFDQLAAESALKQMARSLMPFGVPVGVSTHQVLHALGEVGLWCPEEEMDMVRHPYKGKHLPAGAEHSLFQPLEHSLVVVIPAKNRLPRVPSSHRVVDRARILDSKRSCHPGILEQNVKTVNRV